MSSHEARDQGFEVQRDGKAGLKPYITHKMMAGPMALPGRLSSHQAQEQGFKVKGDGKAGFKPYITRTMMAGPMALLHHTKPRSKG